MNLNYAIDRLYETGWNPSGAELEESDDGRQFPSVISIQREFTRAGLELSIKHNLMFKCYRASWVPIGQAANASHQSDATHGAVVGSCEREAAVYALAQLRANQSTVMAHA